MSTVDVERTARAIVADGKGILAAAPRDSTGCRRVFTRNRERVGGRLRTSSTLDTRF
jgi:hypothetical protein